MADQFYTVEKLGPKQSKTHEGFLLCEEVPLARTGVMLYAAVEIPNIEPAPDGIIKISRNDEDVFAADTVTSANGKPVTNDHPDYDVDPTNWNDLAIGVCMNVRRGTGLMDDLLLGDLLITNKDGIDLIESGKREISLGYTADIEETGPGEAVQKNIIINHIALVENGRCGRRCAIADKATDQEKTTMKMTNKRKAKLKDRFLRLRDAMKVKDADEAESLMDELEEEFGIGDEIDPTIKTDPVGSGDDDDDDDIHIHLDSGDLGMEGETDPSAISFTDDEIQAFIAQNQAEHEEMMARIEALEAAVMGGGQQDLVTDEDPDVITEEVIADEVPDEIDVSKMEDSEDLEESFKDAIAYAEILSPGIKVPVFDSRANPRQTVKKICGLRRAAVKSALKDSAMSDVLKTLNGGKEVKIADMSCGAVKLLFNGAANLVSKSNNHGTVGQFKDAKQERNQTTTTTAVRTPAEMNKFFNEFYSKKK